MSSPPDPFEFLKNLWGPMGLPLAGLSAPTAAAGEVDRRIAELRSVEAWLTMNLNVLRMSIQGLEMQKAGLAAMQSAAGTAPGPSGDAAQPPSEGGESAKK
ncbi:MAG TPA: PhaM family polyhydroxyalkanoate granule multifunctional regulatory protein [Burkholderiales bacterium]|nr:PhaM family polyhydroxyalkanoate granule multifunctional regulatory protein [Burkholderiales bacterium]